MIKKLGTKKINELPKSVQSITVLSMLVVTMSGTPDMPLIIATTIMVMQLNANSPYSQFPHL